MAVMEFQEFLDKVLQLLDREEDNLDFILLWQVRESIKSESKSRKILHIIYSQGSKPEVVAAQLIAHLAEAKPTNSIQYIM